MYGGGFHRVYNIFTSSFFNEYNVLFFSKYYSEKSIRKKELLVGFFQRKVDFFYITSLDSFILPFVFLAYAFNIRVVIGATLAGKDSPKNSSISRHLGRLKHMAWKKAYYIAVNSIELLNEFSEYPNVVLIVNGVDELKFKPSVKKKNSILYCGAIVPRKGLHRLLEKLDQYPTEVLRKYTLQILGDGSGDYYEACLRSLALLNAKGLRTNIIAHTNQPQAYFAVSDFFVLPSLSEGMPNVILEAIASKCRILTTEYIQALFDFSFSENLDSFDFADAKECGGYINLPSNYSFSSMCVSYVNLFK
jgi:glycosyltransferase involved in cell wall biosynthesis